MPGPGRINRLWGRPLKNAASEALSSCRRKPECPVLEVFPTPDYIGANGKFNWFLDRPCIGAADSMSLAIESWRFI